MAPHYALTRRERLAISAKGPFVLPANVDPLQLAMLRINPANPFTQYEPELVLADLGDPTSKRS